MPLLRFELRQIFLESLDRYFLPLPKLTSEQMRALRGRLESSGFSVKVDGGRLRAKSRGSGSIIVALSGLAWSGGEMLDEIAPAVPDLLRFPRAVRGRTHIFAAKSLQGGGLEVQFFPRMESLRLWMALRRAGESGLTPDEKVAVSRAPLLDGDQAVECVSDYPTDGCSVLQVGTMQYYRSSVPAGEFVSNLRTISSSSPRNCYLPRTSVIRLKKGSLPIPPGWRRARGVVLCWVHSQKPLIQEPEGGGQPR